RLQTYVGECPPFNQLHAEVMLVVMFADFVNGNDVRMIEPRRSFSFRVKTLDQRGRGQLTSQNHLERDGPIQAHLPGAIDYAHATAGDFFEQFVIPEVANVS